jgi:hypothetical protein
MTPNEDYRFRRLPLLHAAQHRKGVSGKFRAPLAHHRAKAARKKTAEDRGFVPE